MDLDGIRQPKTRIVPACAGVKSGEAAKPPAAGIEVPAVVHESVHPASCERLMEVIISRENMKKAWKNVAQNHGAPGVDGLSVEQALDYLHQHWLRIREELLAGNYKPQPVRCVYIPKPGGGERRLGIPTVTDRLIQQAVLQVIQPRWDRTFSDNSYGFRPGRRAHQAVVQAHRYIEQGYTWVVDIDLEKFFDRVNHDQLMSLVAERIQDKRLLKLIRAYLNAGVLLNGLVGTASSEGMPQGGPLSPILSNLFLDRLDRELERRGLKFVRYADDSNIYVKSERSGKRVMESITRFINRELKLKVNEAKSAVAQPWERSFLGFSFSRSGNRIKRRLAPVTIVRFKERVRELTRQGKGKSLEQTCVRLAEYLRGWNAYFSFCQTPATFANLTGWIRRRLRAIVWRQWKTSHRRKTQLRKLGLAEDEVLLVAGSLHGPWRTSAYQSFSYALNNAFFDKLGLPRLTVSTGA